MVALVAGTDCIVGRSHECNYPAAVLSAPILTGAYNKFESSRQMHEAVNEHLKSGKGLYWVDEAKLQALQPDVIVTQSLCDVCSVDITIVSCIAKSLKTRQGAQPDVYSLNPQSLQEVLDDCEVIGRALGMAQRGTAARAALQARIDRATEIARGLRNPDSPPKIAFLEWTDPFFIGGHWTPQIIEMAGACHPLNPCKPGTGAGKSIAVENDTVRDSDPDWIVVCPCGLSIEATKRELKTLEAQAWWGEMRAVREGRAVLVDGDQMFNRPGPRLVDGLEWLVGLLYDRPDLIPGDFPWQRYSAPAV